MKRFCKEFQINLGQRFFLAWGNKINLLFIFLDIVLTTENLTLPKKGFKIEVKKQMAIEKMNNGNKNDYLL